MYFIYRMIILLSEEKTNKMISPYFRDYYNNQTVETIFSLDCS